MKYITAFFMAWGNFCILPCPCKLWDDQLRRVQLVFFPMIGMIMGILWFLLSAGMSVLWISLPIKAVVLSIFPFFISGFIHLDGFMDCSDAILSRRDLAERQRILKDSHVGAFAVICVIILFMVMYSIMWTFAGASLGVRAYDCFTGLILIPVVSRVFSAYGVLGYQPIGHSQYNASFDPAVNGRYQVILMFYLIGAMAVSVGMGYFRIREGNVQELAWQFGISENRILMQAFGEAMAVVITCITHWLMMQYGRKQLGGMSGDISGYALTISEVAGVLVLAIL